MSNPTYEELLAAQNREFPGSRIMSRREVLSEWVVPAMQKNQRVAGAIAMYMLQHDALVFYETRGLSRGVRYGVEGSEYYSALGGI